MTNILLIPTLSGAGTSFAVTNSAAWTDSIYFAQPGYGPPFTINGLSTTAGSSTVTVPAGASAVGINTGMQVNGTPGLPPASYVGSIPSATTFTLVDAVGNALVATTTNAEASATFNPPPLDITGIGFTANLRRFAGDTQVWLVAQTGNGTLSNGGRLGTLRFNVPRVTMQGLPIGSFVLGLVAADATTVIDLFPNGPATVNVSAGVADVMTLTGTTHP